jgi:hypothetical protein
MSNFEQFIENVKAGKIEGVAIPFDGTKDAVLTIDGLAAFGWNFTEGRTDGYAAWAYDHLCAHIRRWLTGKDFWVESVTGRYLYIAREMESISILETKAPNSTGT